MLHVGAIVGNNVREHSRINGILHHNGKPAVGGALMIVARDIKERDTAQIGIISVREITV